MTVILKKISLQKHISGRGLIEIEDEVIHECLLQVIFNDKKVVEVSCTPSYLREFTVGYLYNEGFLKKEQVRNLSFNEKPGVIRVRTSGESDHNCIPEGSTYRLDLEIVWKLMERLNNSAQLFKRTGGAHASAVANTGGLFEFREDISRHNTVDKIVGWCLLNGITPDRSFLLTTARLTGSMIKKVLKFGWPVVISRSAPSDLGIRLAKSAGLTLIGFVREQRMNVYTGTERVRIGCHR